jgi:hypothetical protein
MPYYRSIEALVSLLIMSRCAILECMAFWAVPSSNPKRYRPASDECRSFNVGCSDDLLGKVELVEAALGAHAAVWAPGCSLVPIPGETELWERNGRRVEFSLQDVIVYAKEYIADEVCGLFRALNQSTNMPAASAPHHVAPLYRPPFRQSLFLF